MKIRTDFVTKLSSSYCVEISMIDKADKNRSRNNRYERI